MKKRVRRSKLIAVAGAVLLMIGAAGEASAQLTAPTINYQGRAVDASGMPLTGTRSVQIAIYDALTGGTALFTEAHPNVSFSGDGVFTVVIGANTPGGIPQSVGFDNPRWLGVTVTGFNNGNELPRLRFHGTPYTFVANRAFRSDSAGVAGRADSARSAGRSALASRATLADSSAAAGRAATSDSARFADDADLAQFAVNADSADLARDLLVPIGLTSSGTEPTLGLTNKGGVALRANGAPYAIVSVGVDSTSERFVSGTSVGNTTAPEPGSLYRDNTPLAWGRIASDGTITADFGILRVAHTPNNPGVYLILLDNPVAVDKNGQPAIAPVITIESNGMTEPLRFPSWGTVVDNNDKISNTQFEVRIRDFETGSDAGFTIVIMGRPE